MMAGSGEGAVRAADALLRANGGRAVLLRMPAAATAGDAGEELGLATPQFQDAELMPAVFRKLSSTATLLVSARAVQTAMGALDVSSDEVLFNEAAGVVIDGVIYAIERVVAEGACGATVQYSLTLRAPLA